MLCACSLLCKSAVYYVAPTGSDVNSGTIASPFLTIQWAQTFVVAGDTVYVRGGNYVMQETQIAEITTGSPRFAYVTKLTKSGSVGKRINYWAYPGEKPVFNYNNVKPATTRINAFEVTGSWIHIKGLEVIGVQVTTTGTVNTQSICFSQSGAGGNNIYEQLSMHDGMAIGFYLTRGGNTLVLNCDAYNNWDNVSSDLLGGNVDGFGAHPNNAAYTGIVFNGCRAWLNSDDGYDCINSFTAITFENCWSFYNGYSVTFQSLANGIGFKAGGYGVSTSPSVPSVIPRNIVRNCVAARNKSSGFYANHHSGGLTFYNNTAYQNSTNYNMLNRSADYQSDVNGYDHIIRNNVSYLPRSSNSHIISYDPATCIIDHNTFLNTSVSVSSIDFLSLDTSLLRAARRGDGGLPLNNFMRLAQGSDLIDAGIDVGLPFYGMTSDIGAFEYTPFALPVDMLSFTASVINKDVVLQWQVASENQNKGWSVERTSSSRIAEIIGFVNGKGTTSEPSTYSFTDKNVSKGRYQYRLRQINLDGTIKYSNIRVVDVSKASAINLEVYPVPVEAGSVVYYTVSEKTNVTLNLFNTLGQLMATLINRESDAGQYQVLLADDVFRTKGTYFLKLSAGKQIVAKTIIK
jgi:hypothetical protein